MTSEPREQGAFGVREVGKQLHSNQNQNSTGKELPHWAANQNHIKQF